jgi:hypothetical protein
MSRVLGSVGVAAALAAALLLASAPVAHAMDVAPYEDQRDSNYLKLLYRFVYPVGKLTEVFVTRPIHAIAGAARQPDPDMAYEADDEVSACITFRPQRKCSRAR